MASVRLIQRVVSAAGRQAATPIPSPVRPRSTARVSRSLSSIVPSRTLNKRIDVIAKAGRIDVAVLNRPDIDAPVDRDQNRAQQQAAQDFPVRKRGPHLGPLAAHQHDHDADRQRPDDPPGHEFERRHRADEDQIERKETPDRIGADRGMAGPISRRSVRYRARDRSCRRARLPGMTAASAHRRRMKVGSPQMRICRAVAIRSVTNAYS